MHTPRYTQASCWMLDVHITRNVRTGRSGGHHKGRCLCFYFRMGGRIVSCHRTCDHIPGTDKNLTMYWKSFRGVTVVTVIVFVEMTNDIF
jgi:hypothetical protein